MPAGNYGTEWYQFYTMGEITYQEYLDEHRRTGGAFPNPPEPFETRYDPYTAYLRQAGLGGKTWYTPAERYKANLYGPLQTTYNVGQRMAGLGVAGEQGYPTLSEFLRTSGVGGLGSIFGRAAGLLRNIFGATPEQYSEMGYEPESYRPEDGTEARYIQGNIGELQQLMKYGLRTKMGAAGAEAAAGRLPGLQTAYYGQRAGGKLAPEATLLSWIKANYPYLTF